MSRKPKPDLVTQFRDETAIIPTGETAYCWLLLDEEEVDKLAAGFCPQRIQERAWNMLSWRRTAQQDWANYQPAKKASA